MSALRNLPLVHQAPAFRRRAPPHVCGCARSTPGGGGRGAVVGDATINGSETGTSFRQALHFMGLGFNLHDTMIYEAAGTGANR